jgi:putative transcription factor
MRAGLNFLSRRTFEGLILVKAACEVCGSPLKTGPNKVEIDGAIMIVCNNCVRLGRPVGGPIVRDARPSPIQSAFRSASSSSGSSAPDYEVDPDYYLKIRQAREKLGLSQDDLGRMLNEKPSVIRLVESKKLKPDLVLTRKFMHHLKVNLLVPLSELEGRSTGI